MQGSVEVELDVLDLESAFVCTPVIDLKGWCVLIRYFFRKAIYWMPYVCAFELQCPDISLCSYYFPTGKVPEMLRMPLVELCLQVKLLSLGYIKPCLSKVNSSNFLILKCSCWSDFHVFCLHYQALDPPKDEAINSAVSLLYEVLSTQITFCYGVHLTIHLNIFSWQKLQACFWSSLDKFWLLNCNVYNLKAMYLNTRWSALAHPNNKDMISDHLET